MDVEIFETADAVAVGAADLIADFLAGSNVRVDLGLAGGSTPQATYAELRTREIDWERVDVWLSDERWVPHDSDESNGHQAARTAFEALDVDIIRPRFSDHLQPQDAAAFYEAELRAVIVGRPHLVLLGMGTDGHTASLFPGTAGLHDDGQRWFIANHVDAIDSWRLTVTPHLLHVAHHVVVIVTGDAKSAVLAEAIERPSGRFPIELLHRSTGTVTVLCDRDAASDLTG